jgi:hypothetical protein
MTAGIAELESLKDISCGVAVDGPGQLPPDDGTAAVR